MKKEKKEKQEEKEEMEATRSHHVRTRCRIPGCEAVVCDIRRHLMVHVKREEIEQDDVEGIAEVMRHGKSKHVVAKGNPEVHGTATKKQKKEKKNGVPLQTAPRCALGLTNTSAESTRSSRALSLTKSI